MARGIDTAHHPGRRIDRDSWEGPEAGSPPVTVKRNWPTWKVSRGTGRDVTVYGRQRAEEMAEGWTPRLPGMQVFGQTSKEG